MRSIPRSLNICTPSECDILVIISRRIGGVGSVTHVREGKCVSCFVVNRERKKSLGKSTRRQEITSKYILKEEDGRMWIAFVWLRIMANCRIF